MRIALIGILAILGLIGCGSGPTELIPGIVALPGSTLEGEEAAAASWSEVVTEDGVMDLETRPSDPYSVRVGFVLKGGDVYIDPTADVASTPVCRANDDDAYRRHPRNAGPGGD